MLISELLAYVDLSAEDVSRLRGLHPKLEAQFPAIADRFYEAVWANPGTAAVLSGPEQVERLHRTLVDWMSTGLLGPYDDAFYEKRSRIGRRHVQIGLAHEYMFTSMSVVRAAYHDRIVALYPPADAADVIRSVNKLLDIELAIMVRHYQLDSDEKLIARERRLQAERISAMQTMTAGLAHEVRNPLNAAKLQLELLDRRLRREVNDPRLTQPSELAQLEIQRLTQLLNDFLAFAKPPDIQLQDRDVGDILRHVHDLHKPNAEPRGITFSLSLPETRVVARVDPIKLHQVLDNLVRNAFEAVSDGGSVSLGLSLASNADGLVISVEDDGPGIPAELHARIYEPFFTTKEGGTGLGMSIVHSLVALHGGTIDLRSDKRGTRFALQLPRRQ